MNVEDNLDSDIFYDFWQLSGYAVALCRNLGHNSKIITGRTDKLSPNIMSQILTPRKMYLITITQKIGISVF